LGAIILQKHEAHRSEGVGFSLYHFVQKPGTWIPATALIVPIACALPAVASTLDAAAPHDKPITCFLGPWLTRAKGLGTWLRDVPKAKRDADVWMARFSAASEA